MKRSVFSLLFVLTMSAAVSLRADEKPSKPSDDQIRALLKNLGSEKFAEREQARTDLMGLPGDSLEDLRRIVTTDPAPLPAVVAALHDVVGHLFLKKEGYTPFGAKGQPQWVLGIPPPSDGPGADETPRVGFPITSLMPGLPSYQYLRIGDLVTGVYIRPDLPISRTPNMPTRTWTDFRTGIDGARTYSGGKIPPVVDMQVLRNGETIRVTVPMAPKPADDDDTPSSRQTFQAARAERAERYWHEKFAVPLKLVGAD